MFPLARTRTRTHLKFRGVLVRDARRVGNAVAGSARGHLLTQRLNRGSLRLALHPSLLCSALAARLEVSLPRVRVVSALRGQCLALTYTPVSAECPPWPLSFLAVRRPFSALPAWE